MDIFLQSFFSLTLDQILGNLNHFQILYQFLNQTERQLVASHLHVFDSGIFSLLLWCTLVFHKFIQGLATQLMWPMLVVIYYR
jgi:hypothetical protein